MKNLTYDLFVSYDDKGGTLRRYLAEEFAKYHGFDKIWHCGLKEVKSEDLPPADGMVRVHPIFMQTGVTVTKKMPELLEGLYASIGKIPNIEILPVWGGEPEQRQQMVRFLEPYLSEGVGLLLMVHSVDDKQTAREATEFLNFLRAYKQSWEDLECSMAYFGMEPGIETICPSMKATKLLVLPFLVSEGLHYQNDMPTHAQMKTLGKEMELLPPYGVFFVQECVKGKKITR